MAADCITANGKAIRFSFEDDHSENLDFHYHEIVEDKSTDYTVDEDTKHTSDEITDKILSKDDKDELSDEEEESSKDTSEDCDAISENETDTKNQLWVNFSSLGDGNVFAVLPKIFEKMFAEQSKKPSTDSYGMIMPSNYEWKTKIYLKMLAEQRVRDEMDTPLPPPENQVLHHWNIIPKDRDKKICSTAAIDNVSKLLQSYEPKPITWTVKDIGIAGCLLTKPPLHTTFEDEQEMRRVYTLIYDVFRYKVILNKALLDIGFYLIYPKLNERQSQVWLLLYDLYHRNFKKRETSVVDQAKKLFEEAKIIDLENILWYERIKIAAAISRIRIKHSALCLNDLLPLHLRDEKVTGAQDNTPVTCWANIRKIKTMEDTTNAVIEHLGYKLIDETEELKPDTFKWDTHCPQFLLFHPSARPALAKSQLVKKFRIIVHDRSFCLGPATFGKVVEELQLTGCVIQSHVNSPRTTAYLATLLSQNSNITKLLAFSAGNRKQEYDKYFHELGMKNIQTYSERLVDAPNDANYLEEVVAVFATPPNSYSAVNDPIDLVCSRGGDLTMLEALTEAEETKASRQRIANILDEQQSTLKFAMSRPQIQLILYETHSELDVENGVMVQKAMKEINKIAMKQHAKLQGKFRAFSAEENMEINNNNTQKGDTDTIGGEEEEDLEETKPEQEPSENPSEITFNDITIPETDIFDVPDLPDLCENRKNACLNFTKEGCYLALIQRKKVTTLNNKYLIEMAESRGLFGDTSAKGKVKSSTRSKKENVPTPKIKKKKSKTLEISRIAAPTLSSTLHSKICCDTAQCSRCRENDSLNLKDSRVLNKIPDKILNIAKNWKNQNNNIDSENSNNNRIVKRVKINPIVEIKKYPITKTPMVFVDVEIKRLQEHLAYFKDFGKYTFNAIKNNKMDALKENAIVQRLIKPTVATLNKRTYKRVQKYGFQKLYENYGNDKKY